EPTHRTSHGHHSSPTRRSSDLVTASKLAPTRVNRRDAGAVPLIPGTITEMRSAVESTTNVRTPLKYARVPVISGTAPASLRLTRSGEHTSELQSRETLVCRLLL